jgi:hypothetical protein
MIPPIVGASPYLKRAISMALYRYPVWMVRAARISKIVVTDRPEIRDQIAQYEHGTRIMWVWSGVGDLLLKALGHELAHGVDDNFGSLHYFTSVPEWAAIHKNQPYFDIDKYRDEPLEYFADMVVKTLLLGSDKMATINPEETRFITTWVFPTLQKYFG